ncbi:MAG: NAD(P)(+) transhydrogenase (Re/Si-specific) subunit beta [Actinomycetota bacterium]|nr:NAD(P)(+) transhydrogenase (Re/Si-specific) subunit beta [Actinomycetota bacterium]
MSRTTTDLLYLVTIVTFILALRFLSSPKRARQGNLLGAAGMALAIAVTLAQDGLEDYLLIGIAMVIGAAVGVVGARSVKMTAMPQMVALFNGVGGGAVALIALVEFHNLASGGLEGEESVAILFSALIGGISFSGSLIAFAKLQELLSGRPIVYPGQQFVNGAVLLAALGFGAAIVAGAESDLYVVALIVAALAFGIFFVLPIGGADMPVVISLLNAFTGLAASAAGFLLQNNVLIVAGALVGASGTLLTLLMGRAMNRSIGNVLFGAFGSVQASTGPAAGEDGRTVRSTTPDDLAIMLGYARKVVFVPGYGLAVAQAQHDVRALAELLEAKGIEVLYGIHPVAGRMPGHMNVLLAEANVPYDQLKEMDEINPELAQTDVVVILGANDVVNPAARSDPGSPIYGMPIIDVDRAASVVVVKRSLSPGFAGIDNPLFYDPKTSMLFADAKKALEDIAAAVKAL